MVHTPKGAYVQLKVGFGNKIYLDGRETLYKVGDDGKIYTNGGSFVSKDTVEKFCKSQGLIKGFLAEQKNSPFQASFCFLKII
ncbi:MAG: hypothetical protein PHV23_01565 [Candidatus Gracilibacteria bacterium]|nr:hypothetical protein [Candidatus Gracilibacteria bacterium]